MSFLFAVCVMQCLHPAKYDTTRNNKPKPSLGPTQRSRPKSKTTKRKRGRLVPGKGCNYSTRQNAEPPLFHRKCVFEGAASVANWQEMCERNANGIKRGKMYFVRSDIYSSHTPNKNVVNLPTISKNAVSTLYQNTCFKLQPRQTVPFLSKQTPILCDRYDRQVMGTSNLKMY